MIIIIELLDYISEKGRTLVDLQNNFEDDVDLNEKLLFLINENKIKKMVSYKCPHCTFKIDYYTDVDQEDKDKEEIFCENCGKFYSLDQKNIHVYFDV